MTKSVALFASRAQVGEKYLTKNGMPVKVLAVDPKEVTVESLSNGHNKVKIDGSAILKTYSEEGINKDAKLLMKAAAAKPKKTEGLSKRLAKVQGRGQITTTYKGKKYTVEIKSDGFYLGDKRHTSLSAAAEAITGHPTSGRTFWGLVK